MDCLRARLSCEQEQLEVIHQFFDICFVTFVSEQLIKYHSHTPSFATTLAALLRRRVHEKRFCCANSTHWSPGNRETKLSASIPKERPTDAKLKRKLEFEGNTASNQRQVDLPRVTIQRESPNDKLLSSSREFECSTSSCRSQIRDQIRQPLSNSSRQLLEANLDYEREVRLSARNYRQSDHYDYSLFGLDHNLDQAVGRHQREAMLYNQGKFKKLLRLYQLKFLSLNRYFWFKSNWKRSEGNDLDLCSLSKRARFCLVI